jgi:hypothetical protein
MSKAVTNHADGKHKEIAIHLFIPTEVYSHRHLFRPLLLLISSLRKLAEKDCGSFGVAGVFFAFFYRSIFPSSNF